MTVIVNLDSISSKKSLKGSLMIQAWREVHNAATAEILVLSLVVGPVDKQQILQVPQKNLT